MPVPLPRELLEHIVGDVVDQATLASCCRLSKSWVDFVRSRLYRSVRFGVVDSDSFCDERFKDTRHQYNEQTLSLLMTLRSKRDLRNLVKTISFGDDTFDHAVRGNVGGPLKGGSGVATSTRGLVSTALAVCSKVERVNMPYSDPLRAVDYLWALYRQGRAESADVPLPSSIHLPLYTPESYNLLQDAGLRLDKLVVGHHEPVKAVVLPHFREIRFDFSFFHLSSLHLYPSGFCHLENSDAVIRAFVAGSHASLRSLAMPLADGPSFDFGDFPSLRHLDLDLSQAIRDFDSVENTLRTLPSTLLSLSLSRYRGHEPGRMALLVSLLPPSLRQLRMAKNLPQDLHELVQLLPASSTLRVLHCEIFQRRHREQYEPVREACEARGIEYRLNWLLG